MFRIEGLGPGHVGPMMENQMDNTEHKMEIVVV